MRNKKETKNGTELLINKFEAPHFIDIATVITDEVFIVDKKKKNIERILLALVAIFFGTFSLLPLILYINKINRNPNTIWTPDFIIGAPVMVITFILSIILFINVIINSDRKFIFNRLSSTVTMRASVLNWKNRIVTFPFKDIKIRFLMTRTGNIMMIGLPQSKFWVLSLMPIEDEEDEIRSISFFTWYMDKNRPLPPLESLDKYREKDYLRRREEGFPSPLYQSTIETPEWEGAKSKYKDKNIDRYSKFIIKK